jgi:alkanesulfonate monooxygenase SsuD/methylene tetrahydromethanopterin reductase-like flavin-dependent oxidoreductase (luciferase family)
MSLRVPLDLAARNAKPAGADRMLFSGTAAQVIGDIRTYQALGVTHFVFDPAPADLRGRLAMMERFAQDVRPRVLRTPR